MSDEVKGKTIEGAMVTKVNEDVNMHIEEIYFEKDGIKYKLDGLSQYGTLVQL